MQLLEHDEHSADPGNLVGHFTVDGRTFELTKKEFEEFAPLVAKLKRRAAKAAKKSEDS